MDYVFGAEGESEILKVKGSKHTNLIGYHQLESEYPDQTIIDRFRVVRKFKSDEDVEGNCYDWYEIDQHYRYTDKSDALSAQAAETAANLEDALCDQDAAMDSRVSAVEDALCDLDAAINGGGEA